MTWIPTALAAWAALNVLLTPVAVLVPPTNAVGKVVHVLLAIGPLDLLKAWQSIGAAMVPPTKGSGQ